MHFGISAPRTRCTLSPLIRPWLLVTQEELMEVVDFFLKPQRFRRSGAKIPRGVLLCGPPGPLQPTSTRLAMIVESDAAAASECHSCCGLEM